MMTEKIKEYGYDVRQERGEEKNMPCLPHIMCDKGRKTMTSFRTTRPMVG